MATELLLQPPLAPPRTRLIRAVTGAERTGAYSRWEAWLTARGSLPLSRHPGWLSVLADGLGHEPHAFEATVGGQTTGLLLLASVRSWLFGKFLVSLPYLNYGGPVVDDAETGTALIDEAVKLADRLQVRHLELRDEQASEHPALVQRITNKVHMRLALPGDAEALWKQIPAKVRNQVRKGQKSELTTAWGGEELLPEFYDVFSRNMRDLGTPVYGPDLFTAILRQFPGRAEFCVVRAGKQAIAAAFLAHGWGVTEVPSASSLREFNHTCANMLMYWQLLERAAQRGQSVFDFGRSTVDGSTYRFKKQWGAEAAPSVWQHYVRDGNPGDVRPDNPKYQRMIRTWQRLPLWLTRLLGPRIVRGIP